MSKLLRQHPLLGDVPDVVVDTLAETAVPMELSTGDVLVEEGEAGEDAFLVTAGRFVVLAGRRVVGSAARGDLIGELALLSNEPRAATVRATRDSTVVRIDGSSFSTLMAAHPEVARRLNRQLVARLRSVLTLPTSRVQRCVVGCVLDGSDRAARGFDRFIDALRRAGRSFTVTDVASDAALLESDFDLVLIRAVPGTARPAIGHADRALVFVDAARSPHRREDLQLGVADVGLVLVHPATTHIPTGTHLWLGSIQPDEHFHVREDDRVHADRLVRRLESRANALVLSGGGARGLAHIGVYSAIEEAGVDVDVVGGVSSGAIFAAMIGREWTADYAATVTDELLISPRSPVDMTLPSVALARGRRINQRIRQAFEDDLHLEDLWRPTFLVSSNLTTADVYVHKTGPTWRAVRASVAIPGVFPPMAEPEGLLVDGGLVDNLPVARMRSLYPGSFVIASDVGRRVEFSPDRFPTTGDIAGTAAFRSRLLHRRGRPGRLPGLVSLLGRLSALGGAGVAVERGDIHIEHPLPGVGMFDFGRGRSTIESGYELGKSTLALAVA